MTVKISKYQEEVFRQIEAGIIVCPVTKQSLCMTEGGVKSLDGEYSYKLIGRGVPALITDQALVDEYAKSSERMNAEYSEKGVEKKEAWYRRIFRRDYRTKRSIQDHAEIYSNLGEDAVCLAIGGGPTRAHPKLLNLNIGPFPNVDVVGDAHCLPYADNSVDAIHCEAVFEHLHTPVLAASEIFRVLKKGGKVYVCTPFMQAYHGYPHHYQNFTLTGHVNLFEKAGLKVVKHGVCVGPSVAMRVLISSYITNYFPFPLNKIGRILWALFSLVVSPFDLVLGRKPNAHVLASLTYLVAEKN
jgi:SAM-dependent methyltransferase